MSKKSIRAAGHKTVGPKVIVRNRQAWKKHEKMMRFDSHAWLFHHHPDL